MKSNLSALLLILALIVSMPAMADSEVCRMSNGFLDNGIGGTGHYQPTGGNGIGGTGHALPDSDNGNGIGGTGARHEEKAEVIYVSGTIYAFGSVCINGIRVTYDDSTPVKDGKNKTNANALQLGQVVQVVAEKHRGETSVRAQTIRMVHVLEGPVTKIDKARNMITVLGEPVHVSRMSAASFKEGQAVRVSGMRDRAGEVVATHIAPRPSGAPDTLRGPVRKAADGRTMVGSTPVKGPAGLAVGAVVDVSGQWNGRTLSVTKVTPVVEKVPAKAVYVSIEGYVADGKEVAGHNVVGKGLPQGRVIVAGSLAPNGSIEAKQVKEVPKSNTQTRDNNSARTNSGHGSAGSNSSDNRNSGSGHGNGIDESTEIEGNDGADDEARNDSKDKNEDLVEKGKSEKSEKSEKTEKLDQSDKAEKSEAVEKIEKVEEAEKVEVEKAEKVEVEKVEVEKVEVEKVEKVEVEKPEKVEVEKPEKVEIEKPEKVEVEKPEKVEIEKPEKVEIEKPEKIEIEKPEKLEKPED